MSEVKHTFLKSFWGKKLEGEHGVWFGGEWEEREWFVWLISLIWQDKGIREGKSWVRCEQILGKHSQVECGAQASRGQLHVTRGWGSAAGWEFELTAQGPLHKNSLTWSTGEPQSTACDKGMSKRCPLRIWADCPRTAPQKLPHVEHRWASVDCVWQGGAQAGECCQLRIWVFFPKFFFLSFVSKVFFLILNFL